MSFGVFQFRRGTAAAWTSANPTLASGEMAIETDTAKFKVGDGTTAWTSLGYGGIVGPTGPSVNAFLTVTGNSGTASADTGTDSLAITGSNGLLTTVSDNPEVVAIAPTYGTGVNTFTQGNDTRVVNAVQTTRTVNTTAPITGGGDLSADRTLALTTSPAGQTPVGVTRNVNTTAPITGGGALSADLTLALTTSPVGQTPVGVTRNVNTTAPITGGGALSADLTLALTTTPTGQTPVGATRTITTTAPLTIDAGASADLSANRTLALTTSPTGQTPVGVTRTLTGTAPITIDGGTSADLSANRTVAIAAATISAPGSMSATDKKKLNLHIYDVVADYGADPTGSSNSSTAIQNAVNAAQVAGYVGGSGGIIWFPAGRYLINSTIVVTGNNIQFWGAGAGTSLDFGVYYAAFGSVLVPGSAIKAIQVIPVQTTGLSGTANVGFKIHGVAVDCYANSGTIGLQLISCANFDIDDFYCINATDAAIDFNTLPAAALTVAATFPLSAATLTVNSTAASGTGPAFAANSNAAGTIVVKDGTGTPRLVTYTGGSATTFTGCSSGGTGTGTAAIGTFAQILPGAQDTTRGRVATANVRAIDGGAGSGIGIRINGDGGGAANTNLINFIGPIKISHHNGIGIKDINSDTNYFNYMVINRTSTGTGIGTEIGAATTAAFASRNNVFNHCSFGPGGLTARGTPTATFASGPTYVMNLQLANAEALPTIEAGAMLYWYPNSGFRPGALNNSTAAQAAITAATTAVTGSVFAVPPSALQVGTTFKWTIAYTQTTTAVATNGVTIRFGSTGTASDAAIATWTPTSTVAAATAARVEIYMTVVTTGATGSLYAKAEVLNGTANGLFGTPIYNTVATTSTAALNTLMPNGSTAFLSVAFTAAASNTLTPQIATVECLRAA